MKKFYSIYSLLLFVVVVLMASCKGKEEVAKAQPDEVLISTYCAGDEFFSDKENIRASSVGESIDQSLSKKKARTNTLEELASKIDVTVKAVIDNYYNSKTTNEGEDLEKKYEGLTREVIDQRISGYKTICEKVTKSKAGHYKTYLCFELKVDDLLNPLYEKINEDPDLELESNYESFKQTFDEEMSKREKM